MLNFANTRDKARYAVDTILLYVAGSVKILHVSIFYASLIKKTAVKF